ncbi:transketolase [Futiania mangrovi]|uniref:Transketolase n=1 Tax=Futiania mangrovi TaxID=2959716 RepID=A0A9J6P9G4_9PROT|nr:transketolase [Futiania mangrovii]MCP1334881.1 transketolase [Futiania mangrovii]
MTTPTTDHTPLANALRALSMDAVEAAKSGHPGMPMGMADVATVLFRQFLKFDPKRPDWADRDRFVLSAGHGSMLLYSLLHLTGYEDFPLEQLKNFRQLGSRTAGHPEYGHGAGIETTTGPLGQGIATAVGMALGERMMNARFGDALVDHHTYVIAGDGDLMEGVSHEAIGLAGHLKLGKLIVLFDDNQISIDGPTKLAVTGDMLARFEAAGWETDEVDGHDPEAVAAAIARARTSPLPSLIACKTVIGYGAPNKKGTAGVHGSPLGADEIAAARKELNWPYPPFEIPEEIRATWTAIGAKGAAVRKAWEDRLAASGARAAFEALLSGALPAELSTAIAAHKKALSETAPAMATRVASQKALEVINPIVTATVGGSADLTGSNNTLTKGMEIVSPENYGGRYIHYGVREHGMAACMNGLALHGGFIPYGGTFLVFSDYSRPAIRLAALMGLRVVHVLTHDSIGLGEDGPTHQPVEHMAALRAIPNLLVFRPADAVETAECWELALQATSTPSALALTRQNLPTLRTEHTDENLSAKGAYVLREAEGGAARVTLLATGSEVEIAVAARDMLQADGVPTRVVSMPSWELFAQQDEAYRTATVDPATVRIAVEAACPLGWARWTGENGAFIGMEGFGASAPYKVLYEHFGITAENVADAARARL